jgi:glucosamine--fructose-6-phosphate aminotransferase (isomerizing)
LSLYHEILEQPHVLANLVLDRARFVEIAASLRTRDWRYIMIAARGTSDHAGLYAKYLFGQANGLPVALAAPSLFTMYHTPPKLKDALVIGISQSGVSDDIVSVIRSGREQGAATLAITNDPSSPLAAEAEYVIDVQCGEEKSVAATKTYTAELMCIAMLSCALSGEASRFDVLEKVPEKASVILELDQRVARMVERYRYMSSCVVLGRGFNYASAFEWSLKLKELAYVAAEPYSSADFAHGPIAVVEGGFPVLVVLPRGDVSKDMLTMVRMLVKDRQAELVAISNLAGALESASSPIPLPDDLPEWISPIIGIIPAQLFVYYLARAKGYDPEHPRGLAKITSTQ